MATKTIALKVQTREQRGSRANKRLRDTGEIPGVIYGHKEDVIAVRMDRREVSFHLSHGAHVFDLDLNGKSEKVLVKDVQYDHLGSDVLHVDFRRVSLDERVKITVPLELKGEPKGAEEGGVLQQIIAELQVECRVLEIPDIIRHNVSDMALDSVLHIKDLQLPPNVKVLQDGELIVATVKEVLEVAVAAPVEGAVAEPEVIGRKVAEGEEGAEGAAAAGAKPEKGEKEKK